MCRTTTHIRKATFARWSTDPTSRIDLAASRTVSPSARNSSLGMRRSTDNPASSFSRHPWFHYGQAGAVIERRQVVLEPRIKLTRRASCARRRNHSAFPRLRPAHASATPANLVSPGSSRFVPLFRFFPVESNFLLCPIWDFSLCRNTAPAAGTGSRRFGVHSWKKWVAGMQTPAHLFGRAKLLWLRQRRTSNETEKDDVLPGAGNPVFLSRDLESTARPVLSRDTFGHSHQFRGSSGCQREDLH